MAGRLSRKSRWLVLCPGVAEVMTCYRKKRLDMGNVYVDFAFGRGGAAGPITYRIVGTHYLHRWFTKQIGRDEVSQAGRRLAGGGA
jgi:hypothetical protein